MRRLAEGFAEEFAETVAADERLHELVMELASEFVEKNIPIVNEDDATDVAMELLMNTTVTKV